MITLIIYLIGLIFFFVVAFNGSKGYGFKLLLMSLLFSIMWPAIAFIMLIDYFLDD